MGMTSDPQVFIVMGMTGEYSDSREWAVAAYLDEHQAQLHLVALDEWLLKHGFHMNSHVNISYISRYDKDHPRPPLTLDRAFDVDYTGTRYYVMTVSLLASAPSLA